MTGSLPEKLKAACTSCRREAEVKPNTAGEPSLPRNWTRVGLELLCGDCFDRRFVPRAVWLPVASVVEGYDPPDWSQERATAGWKALRAALRGSWRQVAGVYNLTLVELAKSDTDALAAGDKGPKLPPWTPPSTKVLYGLARAAYPELDSQSLSSVLLAAKAAYKAKRFERRVLGRATLPEVVAGRQPLPVEEKDSPLHVTDQKQPFVRMRIGGLRFTLRLKNGPGFHRQVATLRKVAAGELVRGALKVAERYSGRGNTSGGGAARTNGGGTLRKTEVMVGVTVYLPREPSERAEAEMVLRTCPEKLLQVWVGGREEPWSLWDDQVRRRIAAHRAQLQRLSDDAKMERRLPKKARGGLNGYRELVCENHRRWLTDYCHKVGAMIAGLAVRNKVGAVKFDCADKSFAVSFPWYKLASLIGEKLAFHGVSFEATGVSVTEDGGGAHELP